MSSLQTNPASMLEANKALIRRLFEEVIPSGDAARMRALFTEDWVDHDPLPGQPPGLDGAEYVIGTMHGAYPDVHFTIDDLLAEGDRVTIRFTLLGTNTGPFLGREPTGHPVEYKAIAIFRIADGRVTERSAGWKRGFMPG
jgi:predicted ester cyclase